MPIFGKLRGSPLGLQFSYRTYLNSTTPQLYVGGMNDSAKRSSEGRNLKCGSEGVQVYSERSVRLKRFAVAIANGTLSRYAAALCWRHERFWALPSQARDAT